jgi:Zn-dependent protease
MLTEIDTGLYILFIIIAVLVSITLHEAMHAYTAYWLGDDTAKSQGRLTLNPISHIDPFFTIGMPILMALAGAPPLGAAKPVPFNPSRVKYGEYGAALVGVAGPLTNFVLAAIGALVLRLIGFEVPVTFLFFLQTFIVVNLAFFVFNMIPFPPLDGSRVLYAFAPDALRRVMSQIESFGLMGFVLFFLLLFGYIRPIISEIITGLLRFLIG